MTKSAREASLEARVGTLEQLVLGLLFQQRNELAMWNAQEAASDLFLQAVESPHLTSQQKAEIRDAESGKEQTLALVQKAVDPEVLKKWQEGIA